MHRVLSCQSCVVHGVLRAVNYAGEMDRAKYAVHGVFYIIKIPPVVTVIKKYRQPGTVYYVSCTVCRS